MPSIAICLWFMPFMADALPETCSPGDSCQASSTMSAHHVQGLSLLQYRMGQAPEKAAADATTAAPADAQDATTAAPAEATTSAPATTENATGNATNVTNASNATNATTPAPGPLGCATKSDPRASAWFAETSPDGTPCVFAADVRDEGSHCIMSEGEYGSNGWCYTSADQSTWGSCNELCPLYGPTAKLGAKIDGVAEVVKDIGGMLNASGNASATATDGSAGPAADAATTTAAPADAKEAPAADAKAAPAADAKAAE